MFRHKSIGQFNSLRFLFDSRLDSIVRFVSYFRIRSDNRENTTRPRVEPGKTVCKWPIRVDNNLCGSGGEDGTNLYSKCETD